MTRPPRWRDTVGCIQLSRPTLGLASLAHIVLGDWAWAARRPASGMAGCTRPTGSATAVQGATVSGIIAATERPATSSVWDRRSS